MPYTAHHPLQETIAKKALKKKIQMKNTAVSNEKKKNWDLISSRIKMGRQKEIKR